MRDADDAGLEVLLLRRNRRAGFVPDMYVFPGGMVDASDADPASLERLDGLTPTVAADRLDLRDADPPAIAYYLAAFRETFEETGILLGSLPDGAPVPTAAEDAVVNRIRGELMESRLGFAEALARMRCRMSAGAMEYFAHWITPRSRPRRFDTRFFAARVQGSGTPLVDSREMTEARWLTPSQALEEHVRGEFPMILPTIHTLEKVATFAVVQDALEALALEAVVTILPDG